MHQWEGARYYSRATRGSEEEVALAFPRRRHRSSHLGETPIQNDEWSGGVGRGRVLLSLAFHPRLLKGNFKGKLQMAIDLFSESALEYFL